MSFTTKAIICVLAALVMFAPGTVPPPVPLDEQAKIEALIKHVTELQDAVFLRNGQEYQATHAARFMRGKWEASAAEIKTAEDFIVRAASVSSTSGKPYLIRFKDGTEVTSGDYLRTQLKQIEQKGKEAP